MSEIFAKQRNDRLFVDSPIGHAKSLRHKSKRENSPSRHSKGAAIHPYANLFADGNDATPQKRFSVVSMFSGCGGMDLGFHGDFTFLGRKYDPLPFDVIWANELNPAACRTYRKNLGVEIKCEDVWAAIDSIPQQTDILIGGPNAKTFGLPSTRFRSRQTFLLAAFHAKTCQSTVSDRV